MNFLATYKNGTANAVLELPHGNGMLHLVYDEDGLINNISWVPASGSAVDEPQLYFDWANEMVTYKTENSLAGQQWSVGRVTLGTVYDDSSSVAGQEVSLADWVEQCVKKMGSAEK